MSTTESFGRSEDTLATPAPLPWLIAVLCLGLLVPLFTVTNLPLSDYVNHLARIYAINHLQDDSTLQQFYYLRWDVLPNLATDALSMPLSWIFSNVYVLGKVIYGLSLMLIVSGVLAMQMAIMGRLTYASLLVFLFTYSDWVIGGALNFTFSMGVAYWAVACYVWLHEARASLRVAVSTAFAALLFVSHLFGFGLFGLGTLCYELWATPPLRTRFGTFVRQWFIFGLPFLIAAVPLLLASPTTELVDVKIDELGTGEAMVGHSGFSLNSKMAGLYTIFRLYSKWVDLPFAGATILLATWALWTGRLRLHPSGWLVIAVSIPVFLAMPDSLMGSWGADSRFPVTALLLTMGFCEWRFREEWSRAVLTFVSITAILFVMRVGSITSAWAAYEPVWWDDMQESLERIDRGSTILVTREPRADMSWVEQGRFIYMPCLAIIERSSFVSDVFAYPGHHVLQVKEPYRNRSLPEGVPAPIETVLRASESETAYFADWQHKFDYVYVINARPGWRPPTPLLALVYESSDFQLYRVQHQATN